MISVPPPTNSPTSSLAAGQKLWQVLPLNPTGYGDSPYQCFSAFAGNPMLLSLERLRDRGLLQESELGSVAAPFPEDFVDYGPVIEFKMAALRRAAQVFLCRRFPRRPCGLRPFLRKRQCMARRLRAFHGLQRCAPRRYVDIMGRTDSQA